MKKPIIQKQYIFSLVLGAFLAFSFAPFHLSWLAILSFSGLFILIDDKSNKEAFAIGWWFGFGQFIFGLYWISISLFTDISKFFWILPFSLFLIPAILAIYTGLTLLFVNSISKKFSIMGWRKILLLAVIWVFFEYLRGTLFTGFPWNLVGYNFMVSTPLSQISSITGIYGLSLIAVIFYSSFALINKDSKIFLGIVYSSFALIWLFGFYRIYSFKTEIIPEAKFRLVQPVIKQSDKWNSESRYQSFLENIKLSKQEGFNDVNYVIWSESAVPYIINDKLVTDISFASPREGFVITGALRGKFQDESKKLELDQLWNSIFVINSKFQNVANYDKNHLVPFGEYIPFSKYIPFISKITNGSIDFSEGLGNKTIKLNQNSPSFSPLICYEGIFPNNVIDNNNPPDFLLNLTNDAWFGNSSGPHQHFEMVRMRAIEYGMPVIRVANSGISGLVNPVGEIIDMIPLNQKGIIDVNLMKKIPDTIFMRFGNLIPISIMLILILIIAIRRKREN
jgi:apolipoprotein N-acyltransferase